MFDFSYANILHSNVINFAVMVGIFVAIGYFLKVPAKLEQFRASIQKTVNDSDLLKDESIRELDRVNNSLKNIDVELNSIIEKAHSTAKSFEEKAKSELESAVNAIKVNAEKQLLNEEKQVHTQLLKSVAASSIEIAERQIRAALADNRELHNKYINDFIDEIDNMNV